MRLGCGGCLFTVVVLLAIAGVVAGAGWMVSGLMEMPPGLTGVHTDTAGDAGRAERELSRGFLDRGKNRAVVLTEPEVDALLARHLPSLLDLPESRIVARLPGGGALQVHIGTPLRTLLPETAVGAIEWAPRPLGERRVWLTLRLLATVEPAAAGQRRYLRFRVAELRVGTRRLPAVGLALLFDAAALSALRWPLPPGVEIVRLERGKVVLNRG